MNFEPIRKLIQRELDWMQPRTEEAQKEYDRTRDPGDGSAAFGGWQAIEELIDMQASLTEAELQLADYRKSLADTTDSYVRAVRRVKEVLEEKDALKAKHDAALVSLAEALQDIERLREDKRSLHETGGVMREQLQAIRRLIGHKPGDGPVSNSLEIFLGTIVRDPCLGHGGGTADGCYKCGIEISGVLDENVQLHSTVAEQAEQIMSLRQVYDSHGRR